MFDIFKISIILFLFSFFFYSCDAFYIYTKKEFMAMNKSSGSHSHKSSSNDSSDDSSDDVIEIQLEDAKNQLYGYGTFNDPPRWLLKDNGKSITDNTDFNYNTTFNIYDTNNDGKFSNGKYFRIVNSTTNIAAGLNLTPIAKNLEYNITPPYNLVFIDPQKGKFIMPRPCYWNKLESQSDLTNPQINGDQSSFYMVSGDGPNHNEWGWNFSNSIKFGKCLTNVAWGDTSWSKILIIPDFTIQNNKQLTVSSWVSFYTGTGSSNYLYYSYYFSQNPDNSAVRCYYQGTTGEFFIIIALNGTIIESKKIPFTGTGHFYVVIDANKGLSDGKSIRVFLNGIEVAYTKADIPDINFPIVESYIETHSAGNAQIYTDNIKIWNEVVSEDPSWEYNNGLGREDAMHIIYGAANNYKPGNIKVGYYYH